MTTEVGKICQFKREFVGRIFEKRPTMPYQENFNQFQVVWDLDWKAPHWMKEMNWKSTPSRTKIALFFPCEIFEVSHQQAKFLKSTYAYGMYSESRDHDWKPGFVLVNWLEPLGSDLNSTYEEEELKKTLEAIRGAMQRIQENVAEAQEKMNAAQKKYAEEALEGFRKLGKITGR